MRAIIPLLLLSSAAMATEGRFEKLALTPPMGWNSWNRFGCDVNEKLIREVADAMVASGMKAAGYTYVNIDDCWQGERDSLGFIRPDPKRFPSGMKALAVDQDVLGVQGFRYFDSGDVEVWAKPLVKERWTFCFLNRAAQPLPVEVKWADHPYGTAFRERTRSSTRRLTPCTISGRRSGEEPPRSRFVRPSRRMT
jgi:hypothetical protein